MDFKTVDAKSLREFDALLAKTPEQYPHGIVCHAAGRTFFIASVDEAVVENALHYVFPTTMASGRRPWTISFDRIEPRLFRLAAEAIAGHGRTRVKPGFEYDRYEGDGTTYFRAATGFDGAAHLIVLRDERVGIFAPDAGEVVTRLPIRLLREVGLRLSQNDSACFMHVACVDLPVGGVLIVGGSGAGKTTTLMHLLRCKDSRFVSNDRAVGLRDAGGVVVDAWPLGVRIGKGTHESFSELSGPISSLRRSENQLAHGAIAARHASEWGSRVKYEFTPLELCHRFQRSATMRSRIAHVLYPQLSLDGTSLRIEPHADSREQAARLASEITEPFDEEYGRGWMGLRTTTDEEATRSKRALAEAMLRIPSWRLVGDPREVRDDLYEQLGAQLA